MRERVRGKEATERKTIRRNHRLKCRCCGGTGKVKKQAGTLQYEEDCVWCIDGIAKWSCGDCGEVLPCCKCFDQGGFRRRVEENQVDGGAPLEGHSSLQ